MSEHYDFHYQPTGSGAISGQQVLQQTEDAINELGDYVNDNVGGAMDVAQQALETAQNAEQDAQTALNTANSFSDAIQSAQQDASTALSTAQTAQTTASNANNTAIQAQQDASSAVTTANNASSQVSTLSGTVTALGQRVTTAEDNIGQNTSDITALTTRIGTAEGNITTLQNDVSIAQGNASSAMATAGQVKQQAFVFRYSSTALVDSSTNSNALLDNTDNLKVGDKVIDSSGVLFSITAIDTANSTFTIGTALIDLANDSDVVHKSGVETIAGNKTFSNFISSDGSYLGNESSGNERTNLYLLSNRDTDGQSGAYIGRFRQNRAQGEMSGGEVSFITFDFLENSIRYTRCFTMGLTDWDSNGVPQTYYLIAPNGKGSLGTAYQQWNKVYANEYYYGSANTEFSDKFVTTDTAQTISGNKTFSSGTALNSWLYFTNTSVTKGTIPQSTLNPYRIYFGSGVNYANSLFNIDTSVSNTGVQILTLRSAENVVNGDDTRFVIGYDPNLTQPRYIGFKGDCLPSANNTYECGSNSFKWKSFNGINPGALSMPDLSNGIDISSYITLNSDSSYTPLSDGYVYICCYSSAACGLWVRDSNNNGVSTRSIGSVPTYNNLVSVCIPVVKSVSLSIFTPGCENILTAKFYPCQGNV